jgi:hypothetical protein
MGDPIVTDPATLMTMAQFLGLLAAPLSALLVGYVTKMSWPSKYKALLLVALSGLNGAIVEGLSVPAGAHFDIKLALMRAGVAYVTAIAAHYGFLRPTGASAAVPTMGNKHTPPAA